MSFFSIVLAGLVLITLTAISVVLTLHAARTKQERDAHAAKAEKLHAELCAVQRVLQQRDTERVHLATLGAKLQAEIREKEECLLHLDNDIAWHREQLERRPPRGRQVYRILTIGLKYTGKTSLTLKWANPLVDLGTLKGTKVERYERTVSLTPTPEALIEHTFEIHDWGGEHIVDAQQALILEEIHGVLLVVDLTGKDGKTLDQARVNDQLRAFQADALQFFFGPKMLATCKTLVLFINKSDVLSGTPAEVEQTAMAHYKPLIDVLDQYRTQMDVRVFVGSASSGHSMHHLFAHFVERILPKRAYDAQLLQRIKAEPEPARAAPPRGRAGAHDGHGAQGAYGAQGGQGAQGANGANGANGRVLVETGHARR